MILRREIRVFIFSKILNSNLLSTMLPLTSIFIYLCRQEDGTSFEISQDGHKPAYILHLKKKKKKLSHRNFGANTFFLLDAPHLLLFFFFFLLLAVSNDISFSAPIGHSTSQSVKKAVQWG